MSRLQMTDEQRVALEAAQRQSRTVRQWKRHQAVLLRAAGTPVASVAQTLGCTPTSDCNWTAVWRLDAAGEQQLEELLGRDPQVAGYSATGWTVALLQTELAKDGWQTGERTIRRTLYRLGWKRPRFVPGRPDPEYQAKKGGGSAGRRDNPRGRRSLVRL